MWTCRSTIPQGKADWAVRIFWLALVAVHIAPLLSVIQQCQAGLTAELLVKIAGIALSVGFFGSKAAGAHLLRFRSRRVGLVVFIATVGLVHQQIRQEISVETVAPVVATTCVAASLPAALTRRRLQRIMTGLSAATPLAALLYGAWRRLVEIDPYPDRMRLGLVCAVPRGPPAI